MMQIKFAHNWNQKLYNPVFTTIRGYTAERFGYYRPKIGQEFDIICKQEIMGKKKLYAVWTTVYRELPQALLSLDTGYIDRDKIDALFVRFGINYDSKVMILLFGKEE